MKQENTNSKCVEPAKYEVPVKCTVPNSELKKNHRQNIRSQLVEQLQHKIQRLESVARVDDGTVISECCIEVNRLLPGGGYRPGTLIEWIAMGDQPCDTLPACHPPSACHYPSSLSDSPSSLSDSPSSLSDSPSSLSDSPSSGGYGADFLSLTAAARACRSGGALVVIDSERNFYPPAAAAAGIDLSNLIVLRPPRNLSRELSRELSRNLSHRPRPNARPRFDKQNSKHQTAISEDDHSGFYWAIDQALKCPAVGAVWGPIAEIDERWFRRFQLSAESSGVTGMFIRPPSAAGRPGWSEIQWHVKADGRKEWEDRGRKPAEEFSFPPTPTPSSHFNSFLLSLHLARCRTGAAGQTIKLAIDTITGRAQPATAHRDHAQHRTKDQAAPAQNKPAQQQPRKTNLRQTNPLRVAAELADPAADRRQRTTENGRPESGGWRKSYERA